MIEVNSPLTIKTRAGTVVITVQHEDGKIIIETFQRNGKKRYEMIDDDRQNGTLIQKTN